jgi:hypothetical protein
VVCKKLLEAVLVDGVAAAHDANGANLQARKQELHVSRDDDMQHSTRCEGRTESKRNSKQTGQLECMERSTHWWAGGRARNASAFVSG